MKQWLRDKWTGDFKWLANLDSISRLIATDWLWLDWCSTRLECLQSSLASSAALIFQMLRVSLLIGYSMLHSEESKEFRSPIALLQSTIYRIEGKGGKCLHFLFLNDLNLHRVFLAIIGRKQVTTIGYIYKCGTIFSRSLGRDLRGSVFFFVSLFISEAALFDLLIAGIQRVSG